MDYIFREAEEQVYKVARDHLFRYNQNYLKFANQDMITRKAHDMASHSVSFALGYTGHGDYMYEPVLNRLKKEIEAGILTKNVSYPDDDEFKPQEYQEDSTENSSDKFKDQFGNSNANPNFKKRKNPKEQMTQLERLLMDSTMEESFNSLGLSEKGK